MTNFLAYFFAISPTTMIYLDITTKQEEKALETLENENQRNITKKWKNDTVIRVLKYSQHKFVCVVLKKRYRI